MEATTRKEISELIDNHTAVKLLAEEGYYYVEKVGIADSFAALTDEESGICLDKVQRNTIRHALAQYNDLLDGVKAIVYEVKNNNNQQIAS